jgi:glutathione S-transferase
MASNMKVTYFDFAGRAELSRLALAYAQIPFEDERINGEQFASLKPTLPVGQVPTLTIDGQVYSQSLAIARYAAKLGGIYPQDPIEALRVDMIIDTLVDLFNAYVDIEYRTKDETLKAEKTKTFVETTAPRFIGALENLVTGPYFLGKLTLADLALFDHVENCLKKAFPQFDLSPYKKLLAIVEVVKAEPSIAAYLNK